MIKIVLRLVAVVLILLFVLFILGFSLKRKDPPGRVSNYVIKNGQVMNISNIKIKPNPLKDSQIWRKGEEKKISWNIENLPEGRFFVAVQLVEVRGDKMVAGDIASESAVNGLNEITYKVGSMLIGGDALAEVPAGSYHLRYSLGHISSKPGEGRVGAGTFDTSIDGDIIEVR